MPDTIPTLILEANTIMKSICRTAGLAIVSLASTAAFAQAGPWTFSVTPYIFLPSIDASLRYGAPTPASGAPQVDVGPSDYLQDLQYAFMISGEARRDRWSLFSDLMTLKLESDKSSIRELDFGTGRVPVSSSLGLDTRSEVKAFTLSLLAGYSVERSARSSMDVFAGVRYLGLEASTGWQLSAAVPGPGAGQVFERSGSVTRREDIWDGVVGVRGRYVFENTKWAVPYYIDVGAGDSKFTWQAAVGLTYAFGWGELGLFYRELSYEQDGDKLISDMSLGGPLISATFRF